MQPRKQCRWVAIVGAMLLIAALPARGQPTDWGPPQSLPGVDGQIYATVTYDDGFGPALYAAGAFQSAGGVIVNNVARWSGHGWTPLGAGTNAPIRALAVYDDDGNGPQRPYLYAGGSFTIAGGIPCNRLAKWDGANWSPATGNLDGDVLALVVFSVSSSGTNPFMYVGGNFQHVNNTAVNGFAAWRGTQYGWLPMPTWDGWIQTACWCNAGLGQRLYIGGTFRIVDGQAYNYVAEYTDAHIRYIGGMDWWVNTLVGFNDGSGPQLYAGGWFSRAGDGYRLRVARYDGRNWSNVGSGFDQTVHALAVYGTALYVGGKFHNSGNTQTRYIARWNGSTWEEVGGGADSAVWTLLNFNSGAGPSLYAGGWFKQLGEHVASGAGAWNGSDWTALGSGTGLNRPIRALTAFDDGQGLALYAGGDFQVAGAAAADGVAKWTGSEWQRLGDLTGYVRALAIYDDGQGPALYAGGGFQRAGDTWLNGVAKWDGAQWQPLGSGADNDVWALAAFDDGSGPKLFAAGLFTHMGGTFAPGVALWDGASWSYPGSAEGLLWPAALAVLNDGTGPALYAASGDGISRWNGAGWTAVGGALDERANTVTVFDDGTGPALYAGCDYTDTQRCLVKWTGTAWVPVGGGLGGTPYAGVYALSVYDDGSGPGLWAGGDFMIAGGTYASRVAKWTGAEWTLLGSGVDGPGNHLAVHALAPFGAAGAESLYAGGRFTTASGVAAMNVAIWGGAAELPVQQAAGAVVR